VRKHAPSAAGRAVRDSPVAARRLSPVFAAFPLGCRVLAEETGMRPISS